MMKKISLICMLTLMMSSCVKEQSDLVDAVNHYIESFNTIHSYGIVSRESKVTTNGTYTVSPIGRLVIVKINEPVGTEEYEKLQKVLSRRFKSNRCVRNVYINQGGTVVVDCRN